jgi:hypothetical protein
MNKEKLLYDVVVGYMLKVIKSGIKITKFKNEFNAVKHGDYIEFINLIGKGIPTDIVILKEGESIPTEKQLGIKNADFIFLLLAAPSLQKFLINCYEEFGEIVDNDLKDIDFENLANFEMVLRLFFNNSFINEDRINLIDVINIILREKEVSPQEIGIVQNGRRFLNMVKGHNSKFTSFQEGLIAFSDSLQVLEKYDILLKV